MRTMSRALVGLTATALVVAGCGGDDSSDEAATTDESTAPVTEAPPPTTAEPNESTVPVTEAAPPTTAGPAVSTVPVTEAPPPAATAPALSTVTEQVLTVGRALDVTPFAADNGSGNVVGFEPDLVDAMAGRLGLSVTWVDTDFESLLPDLATGRFDMVASNVTFTSERAEQFGFTDPYFFDLEAAEFNPDFMNIAFPVDPSNRELQAALNEALQSMLSDGTYQSIYDAWFDTPDASVLFEGG